VFYCRSGARTNFSAKLLLSKGFRETYALSGGIMAWKAAGLPIQSARADRSRGDQSRGIRKWFGWLF
jgi:3-mercaptopyruvate sulfurtransferase SseA